MDTLSKVFEPKKIEDKWYKFWLEKKLFHAEIDKDKEHFSIVIPPPNVTGSLHMGHALNNTLQDIIVRKKRMDGFATMWLPGTDHAGIATQNVVEQQLAKEGKTRHDIGREEFVKRVWQWKEQYGNEIVDQLKKLGCSLDWDRQRFTMDEAYAKAVKEVFVRLYEEGLIYRGNYIINWCPKDLTALSDIEVEHLEIEGSLWYIKYRIKDSTDYITVATTRPETMLGDTAVAVNPKDKRFRKFQGKVAILPLLNREIPIIEDDLVDPKFGTGAVKVTPAHDPNDFEIASRHDIEKINIFTPEAKINENGGSYQGMERYNAREAVIKHLEKKGLIEKIDKHLHAVGHCYRCDSVVEPRLSLQWFVKMKPLAKQAISVVKQEKVNFIPARWAKLYFEWMENIHDWCISRQIWWGHQLPVYYCKQEEIKNDRLKGGHPESFASLEGKLREGSQTKIKNNGCGEIVVSAEKPNKCPKCGSTNIEQDEDVLDTWFSSALWPFATLGWPEKTSDLAYFYPTSLLSTGFDIIYFWVARMIMMGLKFMDEGPFKDVYIHALIRDAQGRKMSKSKGNVINPLDVVKKYGTDALRFTLATLAIPGRDVYLSEERVEGNRNFCNKIWNIARFVLANVEDFEDIKINDGELTLADSWILSRLNRAAKEVNQQIELFNFSQAAKALYNFIWGEFADWYIELAKLSLYAEEIQAKKVTKQVLIRVLDETLRLLHPFMPFITEEIWQKLPGAKESIMITSYPKEDLQVSVSGFAAVSDKAKVELEGSMKTLMEIISSIRSIRSELKINLGLKINVLVKPRDDVSLKLIKEYQHYIIALAGLKELKIATDIKKPDKSAVAVIKEAEVYLPLEGIINLKKEEERINKELLGIKEDLKKTKLKLENKEFLKKAPQEIVEKETEKQGRLKEKKEKLLDQLKIFAQA